MSRGKKARQEGAVPGESQSETLGRLTQSVGHAPGLLTVDPAWREPTIRLMAYRSEEQTERVVTVGEIPGYLREWPRVWVNVDGLGNEQVLRELGKTFSLHKLALEDVVNLGQRAKVEPYDEDLFIVARMPKDASGQTEQLSMFLGTNYVLTFQEVLGDCFDGVRERLRHGKGRIRGAGADYLAYALLDAVIDSYFPIMEEVSQELEALEEEVLDSPARDTVARIHEVKRRIQNLRRAIWPHREAINTLLRDPGKYFSEETPVYLRDCYDHTLRIAELIDSQRDLCTDLMSTYLSVVSNRMNEVMKVLAIIGTLFIPLGFIAGLYGMNFDPDISPWNMPELGWSLGYPFALLLMTVTAAGLMIFFWKKGWFK